MSTVGVVPLTATGPLGFALLGREPLYVHAARALVRSALCFTVVVAIDATSDKAEAGPGPGVAEIRSGLERAGLAGSVRVVDAARALSGGATDVLLHDPRCPKLSPQGIADFGSGRAVPVRVGWRPITDTVKTVETLGGQNLVVTTVDRAELRLVCSPMLLSSEVARRLQVALGRHWLLRPFAELVRTAAATGVEVDVVEVEPAARRLQDEDDLRVFAAAGSGGA